VETTQPYYRSTYVFVQKMDAKPVTSLADPQLRNMKIGIHVVGDDFAPPARALARRGIVGLTGFSLFGAYGEPNPAGKVVEAVAGGSIDVAIVWGPLGGYFAAKSATPLRVTDIPPDPMTAPAPTEWSISMAVREGDEALKSKLDSALERKRAQVEAILREFAVPQLAIQGERECASCR
jgi:mxaJ protein